MSEHLEINGEVIEVAKGGFIVRIDGAEDSTVFARLSGKMRQNKIRVLLGDKVTVKVSPYDLSHGMICVRH